MWGLLGAACVVGALGLSGSAPVVATVLAQATATPTATPYGGPYSLNNSRPQDGRLIGSTGMTVNQADLLSAWATAGLPVPTPVPQFTAVPQYTPLPTWTAVAVQPVVATVTFPTPLPTWTPFPTPAPQFTPSALVAGENHIGSIGGNTLHPSSNPTLSVAASYATGDYVGTSATPWSWTGCRVSAGTGQLQSVTVIDKALQSIAGELWLFDRSVTVPNDSAAWTITDADAQFLIGVVPFSTYYASAANSVSSNTGLSMPIWCNSGTSIFGAVVTRGAPSYTSGDLTVVLGILAD
jgi:hypothetical protein